MQRKPLIKQEFKKTFYIENYEEVTLPFKEVQGYTSMESQIRERIAVTDAADLAEGTSKLFHYQKNGESVEGFLIRHQGKVYAYMNLCPHAYEPIIFGTQCAFNSDKRYIVCREHFAMFNPETGVCVSGPCPIADLIKIEVFEQDGTIYIIP